MESLATPCRNMADACSSPITTTTTKTLAARADRVQLAALPPAFREAVLVMRELGAVRGRDSFVHVRLTNALADDEGEVCYRLYDAASGKFEPSALDKR
jgi:hypothetical protein